MKNFSWQHIEFANGSNPYICLSEKEFKRIKRKYNLSPVADGFWYAEEKNCRPTVNLFDFPEKF